MKFMKNYTSEVPVSQTIASIERVLIKCGVAGIGKEYRPEGKVSALTFHLPAAGNRVTIRLPVNEAAAVEALWRDYVDGEQLNKEGTMVVAWGSRKKKRRADFAAQGERTAWKIMQDWVEVQMSMIQMDQADTLEVFLPYIWNGETTVYGRIKATNFSALLPEKASGWR